MRKHAFWLGGIGVILVALVVLAACQLIPGRAQTTLAPTITPYRIPVVATFTPTLPPAPVEPTQTKTAAPSNTPVPAQPTEAVLPTATTIPMPYQLQAGTERFIPAFTRLEQGCAWSGVAGQVFDSTGSGIAGVIVVITGVVDGRTVDQVGVTEAQSAYGPGGYEISLADHLPVSDAGLFIQLFDPEGRVLTQAEPFHMPKRCDQNLVLMNFQALYDLQKSFLPVVGRAE